MGHSYAYCLRPHFYIFFSVKEIVPPIWSSKKKIGRPRSVQKSSTVVQKSVIPVFGRGGVRRAEELHSKIIRFCQRKKTLGVGS